MQRDINTLRPGDSPSMIPTHSLIKTLELLQKAIAYGHVDKAKELVADLAKQRALVSVTEQPEKQTSAFEEDIKVKVHVEDKDLSGSSVLMKMKPSMTIGHLKQMMQEKLGFPKEIQKWIVGKRLVKDEETLQKLRIKNDSSMFLYLLSPKSVGLRQEEYTQIYQQGFQGQPSVEGEYMPMGAVRVPRQFSSGESSGGHTPSPQLPKHSPLGGEPRRATDVPRREMVPVAEGGEATEYVEMMPVSMPSIPAPPPPRPEQRQPTQVTAAEVGWKCPECTYMNQPTRPGCEMCGKERPEDYQVPRDYTPTGREKERLEEEQRVETLAQQSDKVQQAEPVDTYYRPGDFGLVAEEREVRVQRAGEGVGGRTQEEAEIEEQMSMVQMDESLALALQKQEEEDFVRRHRILQRGTGGGEEEGMPGLVRESYPMQESCGGTVESDDSNVNSFV